MYWSLYTFNRPPYRIVEPEKWDRILSLLIFWFPGSRPALLCSISSSSFGTASKQSLVNGKVFFSLETLFLCAALFPGLERWRLCRTIESLPDGLQSNKRLWLWVWLGMATDADGFRKESEKLWNSSQENQCVRRAWCKIGIERDWMVVGWICSCFGLIK